MDTPPSTPLHRAAAPTIGRERRFAAILLAVALAAWWWSGNPSDRLGVRLSPGDPGPWFIPRLMAGLIAFCGVTILVFAGRRQTGDQQMAASEPPPWRWSDAATIVGIGAYVALVPVIGFSLATMVGAPLFMFRQGLSWRWWTALSATIVFIVLVKGLFGHLFGISVPEGWLQAWLP